MEMKTTSETLGMGLCIIPPRDLHQFNGNGPLPDPSRMTWMLVANVDD